MADDDAPQRRPIKSKSKRDLQLADDWQAWSRTASGQRAIADLMAFCDVYASVESNDPIELAKAIERQNVAKRIAYYLGLQASDFPERSWDDTDLLYKMMNSQH